MVLRRLCQFPPHKHDRIQPKNLTRYTYIYHAYSSVPIYPIYINSVNRDHDRGTGQIHIPIGFQIHNKYLRDWVEEVPTAKGRAKRCRSKHTEEANQSRSVDKWTRAECNPNPKGNSRMASTSAGCQGRSRPSVESTSFDPGISAQDSYCLMKYACFWERTDMEVLGIHQRPMRIVKGVVYSHSVCIRVIHVWFRKSCVYPCTLFIKACNIRTTVHCAGCGLLRSLART